MVIRIILSALHFPMLTAAFMTLAAAVLLGTGLAVAHLRSEIAAFVPGWLDALHAVIGLGGLGLLALALREPTRGLDQGTGSFGMISAALIALAALIGGAIFLRRLKQQCASALLTIHATLAVTGFVMFAAYFFA
jgi:hypothetical protein